MVFVPRTFDQILADMVAFVQSRTELSDFNVGSVIRTILEAAALEDDEQYFQMVQLLDSFSLMTASGGDLDRRLADFGVSRLSAQSATGSVVFYNGNLITNSVAVDLTTSATALVLSDSSSFPTSGYPYTVRVGEGLASAQDLSITANDIAANTLTLAATTPLFSAFPVGTRVSLVTGSSSYVISMGTNVEVPATVSEPTRTYVTRESGSIAAGNYASNAVVVSAIDPGSSSNVGVNRISRFSSSAPFPGALVLNTTSIEGGTDRESDVKFRKRAIDSIQSLSRGTPQAVRSRAVGVTDPVTGKRVLSASIQEDFSTDEVFVYVDDGTGTVALAQEVLPSDSLPGTASSAATTLTLSDSSDFPSTGTLLLKQSSPAQSVLLEYVANDTALNTVTLQSPVGASYNAGTLVYWVDPVVDSAEPGQRRFSLGQRAVVKSSLNLYINDAGSPDPWRALSSSEYVVNPGTGEIKLVSTTGLASTNKVVASYAYHTNLLGEVQRVLEGDLDSPVSYPGVKAAGVLLSVLAPTIKRVVLQASLTVETGYSEDELSPVVQQAVEGYINSLSLGEDLILSKVVEVAHQVVGVRDFVVTTPTGNVSMLENEIASPYSASAVSLVSIR